jgi:hypothetical protein
MLALCIGDAGFAINRLRSCGLTATVVAAKHAVLLAAANMTMQFDIRNSPFGFNPEA